MIPDWLLLSVLVVNTLAILVLSAWAVSIQRTLARHMQEMASSLDAISRRTEGEVGVVAELAMRTAAPAMRDAL